MDDFPFTLRISSVIYFVYFSNGIMIHFNKYLSSTHCAGTGRVVRPALGKRKGTLVRRHSSGTSYPRATYSPPPPHDRSQVAGSSQQSNPSVTGPCAFKSAWRGASAHPGAGSRVALLALLAATG
jgi:hypothetical protein